MSLTRRLGCFFLMVGGLVFLLFLTSDMVRVPLFNALWISLPILGFGFYLWRKGRPKAIPSGRFRLISKIRSRDKITPEERRHGS
jgi:hypothetical protein